MTNKFMPKGRVKYINETILSPENSGLCYILSLVSQGGEYKEKLDLLLSNRYMAVRTGYREWYANKIKFKFGDLKEVVVGSSIWVMHALCKDEFGKLNEDALRLCVKNLVASASYEKASVHVSTILTDEYPQLKDMLVEQLTSNGINCYFYTEPEKLKSK